MTLDLLTGPNRARMLRALHEPRTVGELAALLGIVPSAASRHVDVLEAAGLAVRRRAGQQVLVARSARGAELLALYE
jgi:DNA-binding transcriptional ArsR family regulator